MIQLVYCILAILILSILTMTSQRGIAGNLEGQTLAEVETQATGVATEVLEFIDQTYFDRYTIPCGESNTMGPCPTGSPNDDRPYCRRVYTAIKGNLTPSSSFTKCSNYKDCNYIEGFDGLASSTSPIEIKRGDFTYNVTNISVYYVDESTRLPVIDTPDTLPTKTTGDQTFTKRVSVTVENPSLYFGTDQTNTFRITFDRVFEYGCATDFNVVPYYSATMNCPDPSPPALPSGTPPISAYTCARW